GELAKALGLARSTVNDRVEVLLGSNLLSSQEPATRGARGRPAATLRFNPRAGITLAAQLGISGVRIAVTDLAGRSLWRELIAGAPGRGAGHVLDQVTQGFARGMAACDVSGGQVHGIGLGTPGRAELLAHVGTARPDGDQSPGATTEWSDEQLRERLRAWL